MSRSRTLSLRETKARLSEAIDDAQGAYVLITRHGRPAAVLVGVEGTDALDVVRRFSVFDSKKPSRRAARGLVALRDRRP